MIPNRVYLTDSDIKKTFKNHKKYKMKSSTSTQSHANRNKRKNYNRFSEHVRQIFASENTRNGVSEHQDFKIFRGSMPLDPSSGSPPQRSPDSSVIFKKYAFIYLKSWTVFLSALTWYRQETLITYFTQRSTPLKEKIG